MKAIKNASIITKNNIIKDRVILFDEKIQDIVEIPDLKGMEEIIDAEGLYLSPGFIDIHIHGCCGYDTMDSDDNSLLNISKSLPSTGVTSFLPTTMTMSQKDIEAALNRIRKLKGYGEGAEILGCHLEGPFINSEYRGAQDGRYIQSIDFKSIESYTDIIKIITFAPELKGSADFVESCLKHEIVPSIGHTGADYKEAMNIIKKGASGITHTFNAMSPLHHRNPGVVGAALDSSVYCELIADNVHVDPVLQRMLLKIKGPDKIVLITDAIRACLIKEGEYELGGQRVTVKDGAARLPSGKLAGSVLTMNKGLENFRRNTKAGIIDVIRMVTENPAKVLKITNKKGSICIGKDSDFTIFDESFNIYKTFVKGSLVYENDV